jgi:hypothetical protein
MLGVGRAAATLLEDHVMDALECYTSAFDACTAQGEGRLKDLLAGWGQLLFLWYGIEREREERVGVGPP